MVLKPRWPSDKPLIVIGVRPCVDLELYSELLLRFTVGKVIYRVSN